jgi:hypothetical protein
MKLAVTYGTFEEQKEFLQKAIENKTDVFLKEDYAVKDKCKKVLEQ